ncbi:MAG: acyl-CoA dehydrogenase family protein [Acidimicrobiia bacterium]|nr:acyl-CoA dehydrogenase family protein [Acidimicrobiia bacterium]
MPEPGSPFFSEDHASFRSVVRSYVENELNPHVESWETDGMMPLHDIFGQMGKLGFLGLEYEPAYGGQGADHGFTVVLAEELGRAHHGSIGMAVGVQADMATPSLAQFGSHELKERFLAPAIRGEMVAAIAVTEPDAGSDVAGIRTRAIRDGDEWVINGSKMYITNSLQADWLCLLVRTSDEGGYRGMSQVIVPTDAPGFEVSRKLDKLGMRASDTGLLTFTDMRVPVANTIGEVGKGFQQQMAQFVIERMWSSYSSVGGMDLAIERTVEYLKQRSTFGQPLIANQHIQFRLAELAAEIDLLRHYNYALATVSMSGQDPTRMASIAKLKSGRLAREVADQCMQFHGGIGYMEETWTARHLRDARLASIGAGADEIMLQVLARIDGFSS